MFKPKTVCVIAATLLTVMTLFYWPYPQTPMLETFVVRPGVICQMRMLDGEAVAADQTPIAALAAGKVAEVCVNRGDRVREGQVLVRLDTDYETGALAVLQQQMYAMTQGLAELPYTMLSSAAENHFFTELVQQQKLLQQAIESKQIRAQRDGVVDTLFVTAGALVDAATVMGSLCGEGLQVTAYWQANNGKLPPAGSSAKWCDQRGEALEALELKSTGTPKEVNGSVVYPLTFGIVSGEQAALQAGDKAPIRLAAEPVEAKAVVPVDALDENGQIWLVKNGAAVSVRPDMMLSDSMYLQVEETLLGERVILYPERWKLENGKQPRRRDGT